MGRNEFKKMLLIGVIGILVLASNALGDEQNVVINFNCIKDAQITKLSIYPGKFNEPTTWITAEIKNISERPMQYETRCEFPEIETSVAAIVPNAVGKIKPGATGKATYQYPKNELPKTITIQIVESVLDD